MALADFVSWQFASYR